MMAIQKWTISVQAAGGGVQAAQATCQYPEHEFGSVQLHHIL